MKLTAIKIGRGDADGSPIPHRLGVHLVAKAYGTTPEAVRDWPADDYLDAVEFLVTG